MARLKHYVVEYTRLLARHDEPTRMTILAKNRKCAMLAIRCVYPDSVIWQAYQEGATVAIPCEPYAKPTPLKGVDTGI